MGCGILYRMVAERIGLSATLATRRTGSSPVVCTIMEWFKKINSAMLAPWHGADGHLCFRTASKTWRLAGG